MTCDDKGVSDDYLRRILNARVYDVAKETALDPATGLSGRLHNNILLKREDTQPVFSFKLRGAYNKIAQLTPSELERGVICASAGNHAQGVAVAARTRGCTATIVMPETTPELKIDAVRNFGGEVVLHGESFTEAYHHARELEAEHGKVFVHPFDDPDVIAGQGTIAMEILRQHSGPIDAIFVAIGGGGMISGIAAYVKALRPEISIIGVQMNDSDAMIQSVEQGTLVGLDQVGLFSDGTAVKVPGKETFHLVSKYVDSFIRVSTDEVCAAIKDVFQDTRSILEPAGALSVAGLKRHVANTGATDNTLIAVTCGANMNFDRLRFVAERSEEREAVFAVTIPERRGAFRALTDLIGDRSVTEFNYRMSGSDDAHIFVGLTLQHRAESTQITEQFKAAGFPTVDLTHDDLAKNHLRYMVGGHSQLADDERLYRFLFPERPGALATFLHSMQPDWNISLFHYRNQGSDNGRVLVGLQVPPEDDDKLATFLDTINYRHIDETHNPAYRLFLGA